jgi:hypothetical protein
MRDREKRKGATGKDERQREKKKKKRGCKKIMRGRERGGVGLGPLESWSRSLTSNNRGA